MGAAYYDDDACIDCGMCTANTSAEKVAASRKIREYLKDHAPAAARVSKIAICGKGGSGKTTFTVLLARALAEGGSSVIVLDADESNPGLGRLLGLDGQPMPLRGLIKIQQPAGSVRDDPLMQREEFYMEDLPLKYVAGGNGLRFIMAGKIEDPFQGCGCSVAAAARDVVEKLRLRDGEVMLIDMEAGVESFGRGVERLADTVLAVVEPSYESIVLAEKINFMSQGMGIGRAGAVLNKIPTPALGTKTQAELEKRLVKVFGSVGQHADLAEAGFEGKPLDSPRALQEVRAVVAALKSA
jgi:CO dehydrogenase maturation factor